MIKKFLTACARTALVAACMALPVAGYSTAALAQQISQVRVEGTERVDPQTVLSYMTIKPGDEINKAALDQSLKNLFATGLFADIELRQDGGTLVVDVSENPVINQIAFEGNDQVEDEDLLAEIQLRPRQVFTRTKVQSDITRLYQIYSRNGRFAANIEPKLIKLDQNRVNLVFEIDEGPVTKVKSIRFVGNKRYDDDRLRSEISTKESAFYRFITADDRYDPDRLAYDQELLRKFYLSQGYADFELISAVAELSEDKDHFYVTFTINEGERYDFGNIGIDSQIRNFDPAPLNEVISIQTGEHYNADEVQSTVDKLTDKLGDLQYAFVDVRPEIKRNRESKTVDVTFSIGETPRVFVERINVNGNQRTLDKVIRREILLSEGDPFNKSRLARSEQRIKNLDYFENVAVEASPGSAPDKTVLDVDVQEKSTGELSLGAGFSTADGPLADIRIRERNLLGRGQDLLLATTIAGKRTEFNVGFTEPYFLNRDLSAGVDAFHMTRDLQDESSFDQKRTGGAFRLGYPLSERWRQTLRLRAERNNIYNVQSNASRFVTDQEGERDTIALSQRTTYDNRDSSVFPTEGFLFWFTTEATGLGGDSKYLAGTTGASWYYSVLDQVIFNLLGEVGVVEGYGGEIVTINERYYLGGTNLRGFEQAGVGPRDVFTDDSLGGNRFYRGTAELSFPLGLPEELGIQGHTFTDFGSLFDLDVPSAPGLVDEKSIRAAAGVGLSWRSPFGPIRVDFAKPYAKEDFDETEVFRFNFGTRF
ncbi:MAG: outer membrane protein assembly factor BamA [Alphaproteobacteria bacterium]|nr:outer membrane protein assembly factor BamA [Alphaproteobacteria bacterium]